ncbi:MAG: molybdopterin molybdotransferase MoeA, partial [Devosia sp.]|nr:molybdopterin molybdotransferase MoeA [Devosia sp.]
MSLLSADDALAAILARVPAPASEVVPLSHAAGRVLLQPLLAKHEQPPFDSSAMDGYAVRAADIVPGHLLTVIGTSQAGAGFPGLLGPNQTVRIFTGAPVPEGADTVIMQEEANAQGTSVSFNIQPRQGHSIRPRGSDFATGQCLIDAGTVLSAMQISVAAAASTADLVVAKRPRIALLATGDELVLPGAAMGPGQIAASNSFGLASLVAPYAEAVSDHGIARDDRQELRAKLETIFADQPDIVITTGGASVGDHDIVQELLLEMGVTLDFWRINMRPGKPLMFGT